MNYDKLWEPCAQCGAEPLDAHKDDCPVLRQHNVQHPGRTDARYGTSVPRTTPVYGSFWGRAPAHCRDEAEWRIPPPPKHRVEVHGVKFPFVPVANKVEDVPQEKPVYRPKWTAILACMVVWALALTAFFVGLRSCT